MSLTIQFNLRADFHHIEIPNLKTKNQGINITIWNQKEIL